MTQLRFLFAPLVKLNPLVAWTSAQVWQYIRDNEVPYNPLHERGFISIGCEPCTRATLPGEHERAGRWWWEEANETLMRAPREERDPVAHRTEPSVVLEDRVGARFVREG